MEKYLTPCVPTIYPEPKDKQKKKQREKLASRELPFNLMVARPVGRQEMTNCPEAQAAMQKEWAALLEQKVWDLMIVREKSDVMNEARRLKKDVQFGRVHGICVEKIANFLKDISHGNSRVVLYFWVTRSRTKTSNKQSSWIWEIRQPRSKAHDCATSMGASTATWFRSPMLSKPTYRLSWAAMIVGYHCPLKPIQNWARYSTCTNTRTHFVPTMTQYTNGQRTEIQSPSYRRRSTVTQTV